MFSDEQLTSMINHLQRALGGTDVRHYMPHTRDAAIQAMREIAEKVIEISKKGGA